MRWSARILALVAAFLVAAGGFTGDLTGSDDLFYLRVAQRQAHGDPALAPHPFHARPGVTLPVAGLLAAGVPAAWAWRVPPALALLAIALVLVRAVGRRASGPIALAAAVAVVAAAQVADASRILQPDLIAAALALGGLTVLVRWGRAPRAAAVAGALFGLSLAAKETPLLGLAGLALAAVAGAGPRIAWRAALAGLTAVVAAETLAWTALAGDPLFRLHAIEAGHNATVWAPAGPHLTRLAALAGVLVDAGPLLVLLAVGVALAPRHRRTRTCLVACWVAAGIAGLSFGSSSPTRYQPLPPLPRMLLPFLVCIPLALPSRAAPAILLAALHALATVPGPVHDPLTVERALIAPLTAPVLAHLPIETDERTGPLLEYLHPPLAARLRPSGASSPTPRLLVHNHRWLHFLHRAYGRPFPRAALQPGPDTPLLVRIGHPRRPVFLALGDGAELRITQNLARF